MPAPLPETSTVTAVFFLLLIPFAILGIALLNTGLARSHSAAHTMLASLSAFAVAAAAYCLCGFAWQGYTGGAAHQLLVSGKYWNLLGAGPLFLRIAQLTDTRSGLIAVFGMLTAGLVALIPVGAGLERWRLAAVCASSALLAGITYPIFAHWAWSGGWLAQLGANYGLGHGFVDVGGSGAIQAVGGVTALSIAWLLGPRRGKYASDGMPTAIPGHQAIFVLSGCVLAWIGWLGLNSAGAILFASAAPVGTLLVIVNTTLSAGASGLMALVITRVRFGRPDVSISANGWVGGLVASSASCAFVAPVEATLIGLFAGFLITFSVEMFELKFGVDDPAGTISVHAIGGIWGLLAAGLLDQFPSGIISASATASPAGLTGSAPGGQLLAQVVGIATILGFVLPLTYGLNLALNFICKHRVAPESERQGIDLYELGAGAYPEFVTHTEEFSQFR